MASKILLLFGLFLLAPCALACRGGERNTKLSFAQAFAEAKLVVFAEAVIAESQGPPKIEKQPTISAPEKTEFKVLKAWKGSPGKSVSFTLETGRSCDIGRALENGSKWIFFAKADGEHIHTASHSRRLYSPEEEKNLFAEMAAVVKKTR